MANIESFIYQSPQEFMAQVAARAQALRLQNNWTRQTLAKRAGITVASLKRFEQTGQIAFERLVLIAHALGRLSDFESLLAAKPAASIDELERINQMTVRKRGRT